MVGRIDNIDGRIEPVTLAGPNPGLIDKLDYTVSNDYELLMSQGGLGMGSLGYASQNPITYNPFCVVGTDEETGEPIRKGVLVVDCIKSESIEGGDCAKYIEYNTANNNTDFNIPLWGNADTAEGYREQYVSGGRTLTFNPISGCLKAYGLKVCYCSDFNHNLSICCCSSCGTQGNVYFCGDGRWVATLNQRGFTSCVTTTLRACYTNASQQESGSCIILHNDSSFVYVCDMLNVHSKVCTPRIDVHCLEYGSTSIMLQGNGDTYFYRNIYAPLGSLSVNCDLNVNGCAYIGCGLTVCHCQMYSQCGLRLGYDISGCYEGTNTMTWYIYCDGSACFGGVCGDVIVETCGEVCSCCVTTCCLFTECICGVQEMFADCFTTESITMADSAFYANEANVAYLPANTCKDLGTVSNWTNCKSIPAMGEVRNYLYNRCAVTGYINGGTLYLRVQNCANWV